MRFIRPVGMDVATTIDMRTYGRQPFGDLLRVGNAFSRKLVLVSVGRCQWVVASDEESLRPGERIRKQFLGPGKLLGW